LIGRGWAALGRLLGALALAAGLAASAPASAAAVGMADTAAAAAPTDGEMPAGLARAIASLTRYAPQKQIHSDTGAPNADIGRTPGSACEVMRVLMRAARKYPRSGLAAKIVELADWVVSLQSREAGAPYLGGVPSTPDLPDSAGHYYYAIDAAFCGDAMFAAHALVKDPRYLKSALAFADFLIAMHRGPGRVKPAGPAGLCEFVIGDDQPAWNCDTYVRSLVALPVLARATALTHKTRYAEAAASVRAMLVPGLQGAWEYASAPSPSDCDAGDCMVRWHRVQGPHREPDWFVYGDTLAYGLRALFEYEGPSPTVRSLYAEFSGYRSSAPAAKAYDGRIAFAGYMKPATREPDDASAYYDLVTLGILHNLRRTIAPEDFAIADRQLRGRALAASLRSWQLPFDLRPDTSPFIDLTAIANLAEAWLLPPADQGAPVQ